MYIGHVLIARRATYFNEPKSIRMQTNTSCTKELRTYKRILSYPENVPFLREIACAELRNKMVATSPE